MQQNDAGAFRFQKRQGVVDDVFWRLRAPVFRVDIDAPQHQVALEQKLLKFGSSFAGTARERTARPSVGTKRGLNGSDAGVDFPRGFGERQPSQVSMCLGMRADRVAFLIGPADNVRPLFCVLAENEEICFYAFRGQRIQHLLGCDRRRPVVEGQDNFMVAKGQRLSVLRGTDLTNCGRIDRDEPAGADSRGISRTFSRLSH